jgi:hypothetical protein
MKACGFIFKKHTLGSCKMLTFDPFYIHTLPAKNTPVRIKYTALKAGVSTGTIDRSDPKGTDVELFCGGCKENSSVKIPNQIPAELVI